MPRGNRHRLAGYVWHVTERCHRRQFLLKLARDGRAWVRWLFEARKRFALCVLNYQVTCNHVHLLVWDRGGGEIARSLQLIAGCTGRAYNRRKRRRGAYWEDCYHATAVDTEAHLARCLTYIDLNMVRAGVVAHPREWREAGYGEIQRPPERYRIIDRVALCELLGVAEQRLAVMQNEWIESQLARGTPERDLRWSQAVAVGRRSMGATWRPLSPCATVPHMDSIGVRQLQQNAATTVERVRLGESIEVTVRGRPVAKLVPVGGTLLDQLEASGKLKRGRGDLLDLGPPLKPRRGVELPSVTLAKMRAREG